MPYQTLYIAETEDIVTVTFNRSERRNALTPQMIDVFCANLVNTCFSRPPRGKPAMWPCLAMKFQ